MDYLGDSLSVRLGDIVLQAFIFSEQYMVCTVSDEFLSLIGDVVSQEDCVNLFVECSGQVVSLAQQFQCNLLYYVVALFDENVNVFIF